MKIGCDIDGVLSDFSSSLFAIVNELWPGRISSKYIVKDRNYVDVIAKNEWSTIWNKIENTPFFWYNLKPLSGVADLQKFANRHTNWEFYFITARQQTGQLSAAVQTKMWLLDQDLFPMHGNVRVKAVERAEDKKNYICDNKIDYYLDDYVPTVQELQSLTHTKSYLLSTSYNRGAQLPTVNSVAEYLKIIEDSNGIRVGF